MATAGFSPVSTALRQLLPEEAALCSCSYTCLQAALRCFCLGSQCLQEILPSSPSRPRILIDPHLFSHPQEAGHGSLCFQDIRNVPSVNIISDLVLPVMVPQQDLTITSTKAVAVSDKAMRLFSLLHI